MALKLIDDDDLRMRRIQANGLFALAALLIAASFLSSELLGDAWDQMWKHVDTSRLPQLMHTEYPRPHPRPSIDGRSVIPLTGIVTAGVCAMWGFYLRDPGSFPRESAGG